MKKVILSIIVMCCASGLFAQFENKLNAYVYSGLPIYKSDKGNEAFRTVFNGLRPLPYLGLGLDYAFNLNLSIGPSVRVLYTSKENYRVPNLTAGLEVKYNFVPNDKTISPFIVSEFSVSYLKITQDAFSETFTETVREDDAHVRQDELRIDYAERSFNLDNVSGLTLGLGSDFTIKQKYGMFVSLNYQFTSAHNHAKLQEVYPDNESKYNFFLVKVGLKLGFLRNKEL